MTNPKDMESLKGLKTLKDYGVEANEDRQLDGEKVKKEDIQGLPVVLKDWVFLSGDDGDYAICQIQNAKVNKEQTFTVGSDAVLKVLKQLDRDIINKNGVVVTFNTKEAKKSGRLYWIIE